MSHLKRRLLVLASTYPRWTGDHEPAFVHELCQRLSADFEVRVLCPHGKGARRGERVGGVDVVRYVYAPEVFGSLIFGGGILQNIKKNPAKCLLVPPFLVAQAVALYRELRSFRPEIVHAHWLVPQGAVYLLVCKFIVDPAPFIVTSHGADLYALNGRLFALVKRWVLKKAGAATVVSRAMVRPMRGLGAEPGKISVIPMGVELMERFVPSYVDRTGRKILFVGRLVEKKGCRYLIEAMTAVHKRYPDVVLDVVGSGPEEAALKRRVRDLSLTGVVRFLGGMPNERLADMYRQASVFVSPFVQAESGDREGLGLVLVEAIGCGCKVVVTDMEATKDVYEGLSGVEVVPQRDSSQIAQAILKQLDENVEACATDRQLLVERFDWASVTTKYRELLNSVCDAGVKANG